MIFNLKYDSIPGQINVPPPAALPGTADLMEYVLIADEAFPLQTNLMRPYPRREQNNAVKRRYNYRLSRARRVVENAFGKSKVMQSHTLQLRW